MPVRPGDVVVVRSRGLAAWFIRLAARLCGRPATVNHVAIVVDDHGQIVEAMPQGIVRSNLREWSTFDQLNNSGQPKTDAQRADIVNVAIAFVGRPYDWAAISADAWNVFNLTDPFVHEWLPGTVPARFVCSSLASYVYHKAGLTEPVGGRFCTPADWALFIEQNGYHR